MVLVEITVLPDPDAHSLRDRIACALSGRRAIAALIVSLVLLGAGASALLGGRGSDRHRPPADPVAREHGSAGVAAAYGFPLRCLSVTILAADRAYARADFNHVGPCGTYAGYPTAIFHYAAGRWRPVLEAIGYLCPLDSMPAAVQAQLGVCPAARRSVGSLQ